MARRLPRTNATRNGVAASGQGAAAPSTLTYSTRFDDRQRELIDQAAKLKKWSPAKLIREAAISRAADIVNASGGQSPTLRHLARLVAKQLKGPAIVCTDFSGEMCVEMNEFDLEESPDDPRLSLFAVHSVVANRPSQEDRDQIQDALQTCGESFIEMILEALEAGSDVYKPKVILGDLSNETEAREEASPRGT